MTISDTQYTAWLNDSKGIRCILVEVTVGLAAGGTAVRYLSNKGFVTSPTDTPANTVYMPRINGGIQFTRSMSLDGTVSLSFGDLELTNVDGALDLWLDDYWANRTINVYLGDPQWTRSDFRLAFSGVTVGIDTSKRNAVNIQLSDKLQRLNFPVTDDKLGGSDTSTADNLLPLCFGECHNVTPLLIDGTINEYMVHNGPIEGLIEVRDNGVPVDVTVNIATGKFRLNQQPFGTITASVQGAKPSGVYHNTIATLIQLLVTQYGSDTNKFTTADLDLTALAAFDTAHPQPIGVYLSDKENVLDIVNQMAASVGAALVVGTSGLVSLVQLSLPQSSPGTAIGQKDMLVQNLAVTSLPPVVASVKLGYCKNWTVQSTVAGGLDVLSASLFAEEYLTQTQTNATTAANYNLYTDPDEVDTLLLRGIDATAEASRRLAIFSTQRKVLTYTGFYSLLFEQLGASQTITHPRFGLAAGKTGQIISIAMDLVSPHVTFEVLI